MRGNEGKKRECVGTKGSGGTRVNVLCRNKALRGTKEKWRNKGGVEDQREVEAKEDWRKEGSGETKIEMEK